MKRELNRDTNRDTNRDILLTCVPIIVYNIHKLNIRGGSYD